MGGYTKGAWVEGGAIHESKKDTDGDDHRREQADLEGDWERRRSPRLYQIKMQKWDPCLRFLSQKS